MKRLAYILLSLLVTVLIGFGVYEFRKTHTFPPTNVPCFEAFRNSLENQTIFVFPTFNFSDIAHFKCASSMGFIQYEMQGKDLQGRTFYIHEAIGGRAASGADSYSDICYIQNGETIHSRKIVGRSGTEGLGMCAWINGFPETVTSTYEISRTTN